MPSLDAYLNMPLQPATKRFLKALAASSDGYAIAEGREVWVDYHHFAASVVTDALRHCAISEEQFSKERTKPYVLNGTGRALLATLMPEEENNAT